MAKNISLSYKDFIELNNYCKKKKLKFLTTAFGLKSLFLLKNLIWIILKYLLVRLTILNI